MRDANNDSFRTTFKWLGSQTHRSVCFHRSAVTDPVGKFRFRVIPSNSKSSHVSFNQSTLINADLNQLIVTEYFMLLLFLFYGFHYMLLKS